MKRCFLAFKKNITSSKVGDSKLRFRIAIIFLLIVSCLWSSRLLYLQGTNNGLTKEAQERRTSKTVIPAMRGQILDSTGKILANSVLRYNIVVTPKHVNEIVQIKNGEKIIIPVEQIIKDVARILQINQNEVKKAFSGDLSKNMDQRLFAYVKKSVDLETKKKIDALNISWLGADETSKRIYPFDNVAGNIIGFVNEDGPLAGIEQSQNSILQGEDGERIIERGADGIRIATAPMQEIVPKNGKSIKLTINADIQAYAQYVATKAKNKTGADWVTITVLDAKTGKVIAMAADKTVDPNSPSKTDDEHRYNRNVSEAYEPGSSAKQLFAAAAIQEKFVEPETHFLIPYTLNIGNQIFKDSHEHPNQKVTLAGILAQSSNTGTIMMGGKLTPKQRYDYLEKFGVGKKTGIELPGESAGILNPLNKWDDRTKNTVMFGQGFAATSLQMADIYATLSNGGMRTPPRIIESIIDDNGKEEKFITPEKIRVISEETSAKIRLLLESVVTDGGGHYAKMKTYRMGGKTGTAETASKNGKGFDGSTASFIGVAPMDNVQYVVNATIQRPRTNIWAEFIAAPIVKDIMEHTLYMYNIPPSSPQTLRLPVTYDNDYIR